MGKTSNSLPQSPVIKENIEPRERIWIAGDRPTGRFKTRQEGIDARRQRSRGIPRFGSC
jgi:hypothetical protein